MGSYWEHPDQFQGSLLDWGWFGILNNGRALGIGFETTTMPTTGSQLGEKCCETMDGQVVFGDACGFLLSGGIRGFGGSDRIAILPLGCDVFIVKQQRRPSLTQMPFDQVGQQADEDMRPNAVCGAMMNRPDGQVDSFEGSKNAFHAGEIFITAHRVCGGQAGFR